MAGLIAAETLFKKCTKCGEVKTLASFGAHKLCRDGVNPKCKACNKAAASAWYVANAEKAKASGASRRAANPEKEKASNAKYYAKNSVAVKASVAAWAAANPEKVKAYGEKWISRNKNKVRANTASWRAANPDKSRVHVQNRRALERINGGKLSKNIVAKLINLQRGKCPCCGLPLGKNFHVDHIIPIALGGSNTDNNVQLLRQRCNNQKHMKHPVDFMQQRGFLL
jgi:5-methylcytosine-specific restriction endonuclease McrA